MTDQPDQTAFVKETPMVHSAFRKVEDIEWTDWVMPGTKFKLLNIDAKSGGFSMMLQVSPGNVAPIHGHLGSVEGIITKGGFGYGADRGRPGDYVYEAGGINHRPDTDDDGMEMFAVAHAPLVGFADDGGIEGIVDAKLMYTLARDAGQADHITPPDHWSDI
ncbi:MAG: cupin domain-containing protein [Pseudomonadota bacterium]